MIYFLKVTKHWHIYSRSSNELYYHDNRISHCSIVRKDNTNTKYLVPLYLINTSRLLLLTDQTEG